MERAAVDEELADELGDGTVRWCLAGPLDATHVTINRYRVPPGGGFPGGLHAHADQEELFVLLAGQATFETLDGQLTVGPGEAIRFAPGEYQSGRNAGEDELLALALGAPRQAADTRIPFECPACGFEELRLASDDGLDFVCPDCEAVHPSAPCASCGSRDLGTTVDDDTQPIVVCGACEATFDEPPLED